jgi:molybdate transport system substrate-binding protein
VKPKLAAIAGAALAVAAAALAGVTLAGGSASPRLTILAAASLTDVLPQIAPHDRYSFGGSNDLAAQIQQGAPADVFASADTKLPEQLYRQRLVEKPVVFTRNELVLIVPKANHAGVHRVRDLVKPGIRLVIGAAGVPVGDYTRTVLGKLGLSRLVGKAVSQETDVREVLTKVALGEADAGFVYATDARSVRGKVTTVAIPRSAQPVVRYAVAVVRSTAHPAAARAFVSSLLGPAGQRLLRTAGFLGRR